MGLFGPNINKLVKQQDLPGLLKLLEHPKDEIKLAAANGLIDLSLDAPDEAVRGKAFDEICMLAFPDRPGRGDLLLALREISTKTTDEAYLTRVRRTLVTALEHGDEAYIRRFAALALGQFGATAVEALSGAMIEEVARVQLNGFPPVGYVTDERIFLARALGQTGDPRAVAPIMVALDHQEQKTSRMTLGIMPAHVARHFRDEAAKALGSLGETAVPELNDMVKIGSLTQAGCALEALGSIGGQAAVSALAGWLDDKDILKRTQAAEALGRLGDHRALQPLLSALKHDAFDTCAAAVRGLGELGDPAAVDALERIRLSKSAPALQDLATEALEKIRRHAGEKLGSPN